MPQTALSRWTKSESYHTSWAGRSEALLDLFLSAFPDAGNASFSEYGCGPNQPFSSAVGSEDICHRYDIKAWDDGCRVVDLNHPLFDVETSEIAVLSGVLEYMNNPARTLGRLSGFHKYALISYYPVSTHHLRLSGKISEIKKRAESNGWRNHLTFDGLLATVSNHCTVVSIKEYKRQVLMLLEFYT